MPFELTGNFKGQMVQNHLVSAQDLIEMFNIPLRSDDKVLVFTLHKSAIGLNVADNQPKNAVLRGISCVISGVHNGEGFMIRYYKTRNIKPNQTTAQVLYNYTPKRVFWKGKTTLIDPASDFDLAVFLYLYPKNEQSPIRNPRSPVEIRYDNIAERVKAKRENQSLLASLFSRIPGENGLKILRIAKGLSIQTPNGLVSISSSDLFGNTMDEQIEAARVAVFELAQKYPTDVAAALDSDEVLIRGMLYQAIDDSKIVYQPIAGGYGGWFWYDTNEEIVKVAPGQDSRKVLVSYVMNPSNYEEMSSRLSGSPVAIDKEDKTIVEDAFASGILVLAEDNKVYLKVEGETQKRALYVPDNPDEWIQELSKNLNNISKNRIKSAMSHADV